MSWTRIARAIAALGLLAAIHSARAEFAIGVTPPRLELTAKAGERLRQVIEISNASAQPATLAMKTADWVYRSDGTVDFQDDLRPSSCRPWVAIERRETVIAAGQTYRYRFEVAVPPGQGATECHFAILLESKEPSLTGVNVAVAGRIGVIVYLDVGSVAPSLSVVDARVDVRNARPTAVILVRNDGTAHGRLDGFLKATDAAGATYEVTPGTGPILAGESRWIALNANRPGSPDEMASPVFPISVSGKLEYGEGRTLQLEQRFSQ